MIYEIQVRDIIKSYEKKYKRKPRLTVEDEERLLTWMILDSMYKEIENIKPLIKGGFPRIVYDTLTPYYQLIALIFLFMGSFLLLTPFITGTTDYVLSGVICFVFGGILVFYLRRLKYGW